MKTTTLSVFILVPVLVLSGCAHDKVEMQTAPDYSDYSPGYTGYTVGYDGYGDYDDGYGPSFWNPRYIYYTGYNHGYGRDLRR